MNKFVKKILYVLLIVLLLFNNNVLADVSDNDGSAFITKSEFDALRSSFQSKIDEYNTNIDSKIDSAIASYLSGIKIADVKNERMLYYSTVDMDDPYLYSLTADDIKYVYGRPKMTYSFCSCSAARYASYADWFGNKSIEGTMSYSGQNNKRVLVKKNTISGTTRYVWDCYAEGKDDYSGSAFHYLSVDNDWLGGGTLYTPCPACHLSNGTTTTFANWLKNLWYETLESNADGNSASWAAYRQVTSSNGIQSYVKSSSKYRNMILAGYNANTNEYPIWIEGENDTLYIPKATTQSSALTSDTYSAYSETIESAYSNWTMTKINAYLLRGMDDADYEMFDYTLQKCSDVNMFSTNAGRSGYANNRYMPIMKPEAKIKYDNIYKNDTSEYTLPDNSTFVGYKLSQGIPICTVKANDEVSMKMYFVSNSNTGTSTSPTLYLKYGPFTESETTSYPNKQTYTLGEHKYSFTASSDGTIFAKWTSGNALDIDKSNMVAIKRID